MNQISQVLDIVRWIELLQVQALNVYRVSLKAGLGTMVGKKPIFDFTNIRDKELIQFQVLDVCKVKSAYFQGL